MATIPQAAPSHPAPTAERGHSSLLWTRLGSLLSIVPLGLWTVVHLWHNLAAWSGAEAWQQAVTGYAHPAALAVGFVISLVPLVLHALWGIQRLLTTRPNNVPYNNFDNLKYILQRASAVGVLFFLGAHLWKAMLQPRLTTGRAELFSDISSEMHWNAPTLVVYLLGTLAVAYHLANGLFSFSWTWGLMSGRRSFRRVDILAIVTFLVLLAMAWGTIFALYHAGAQFPPED